MIPYCVKNLVLIVAILQRIPYVLGVLVLLKDLLSFLHF